jgi:hypothetical protein
MQSSWAPERRGCPLRSPWDARVLRFTVLESAGNVGSSWRGRYDGLRLNTPGWMSMLPGYRATKAKYGEFPTRDDWVRYLEDYAEHHGLRVLATRSPLHPADRFYNSRRFPADTEAPAGSATVAAGVDCHGAARSISSFCAVALESPTSCRGRMEPVH